MATDIFSEDSMLADAAEAVDIVERIKPMLPQEMQEKLDDDALYYLYDCLTDVLVEDGILDLTPNAEGFVEFEIEPIAQHIMAIAAKEQTDLAKQITQDEVELFVDNALDFMLGEEV